MYCRYLLFASIGLRIKTVAWDHSPFSPIPDSGQTIHLTKYLLYPFFTHTFVLTKQDYNDSWYKSNISIMPNPVPFATASSPSVGNVVLGVGNIGTWRIKGFDLLIRAWAIICHQYPSWKLRIIGRGSDQYLQSLIDSLGISNRVQIGAHCDNIIDEYKQSSIFVLSSRSEGFPMVLIEAMSQGCATVSFSIKGRINTITDSSASLILPDGDLDGMANAISRLIDNPGLRYSMGLEGLEQSKSFSIEKTLDRWESILFK